MNKMNKIIRCYYSTVKECINIQKRNVNTINNEHISLQYFSDLHVDKLENGILPIINPIAENVLICGDIGNPNHPNYELFLNSVSKKFNKVFMIYGNHDILHNIDIDPEHEKNKIKKICSKNNIFCLDNSVYFLNSNTILLGTTLWSCPLLKHNNHDFKAQYYYEQYNKSVKWLSDSIEAFSYLNIIVMTHYVPSFRLINKHNGKTLHKSSWFASNLEHLIRKPVKAWVCGHIHHNYENNINGVYVGTNSLMIKNSNDIIVPDKVVNI